MKPSLERVALAPGLEICRITTGLQMADQERHGRTVDLDALADLLIDYAETGFDSFDMADHYGSAEIVAGQAAVRRVGKGLVAPTILINGCRNPNR